MTPKAVFRKKKLLKLVSEVSTRKCHEINIALILVEEKDKLKSKLRLRERSAKWFILYTPGFFFEFRVFYYLLWLKIVLLDFITFPLEMSKLRKNDRKNLLAQMKRLAKARKQTKKKTVKDILEELEQAIEREKES